MQTQLAPEFKGTSRGEEAEAILRKCVHCGFCTATCPTYQTLGDELDGPRGRIYLIKQVLEGKQPTRATQQHLDRCLTCRNCETTCPSGVQYAHLLDIGRAVVDEKVPRPAGERFKRWALKEGITSPLFTPAMKLGQSVRGLLPESLQAKVPPKSEHGEWPTRVHERKVLLLAGCVQPSMLPNINYATARVLDQVGIQTVVAANAGCCGAVKFHLNDQEGARVQMRANIDAWWPMVSSGQVEAIVMNASGCGAMVKDYAHALKDDAQYAEKAQRISAISRDLCELLPAVLPELAEKLEGRVRPSGKLAYHPPCTLQHAMKLRGSLERDLAKLGFEMLVSRTESHLCCGSAGTYSILQPELSKKLQTRKLAALHEACGNEQPSMILSSNVGCITHLQAGTDVPVKHWIEALDEALA